MAGGGSRSVFWTRIIAAALDRPLILNAEGQIGPAFGAARLARLAVTGDPIEAVCIPPAETGRIEPDPALASRLAERLPLFRQLYRDLRPRFTGVL
jgi:xylulokinase